MIEPRCIIISREWNCIFKDEISIKQVGIARQAVAFKWIVACQESNLLSEIYALITKSGDVDYSVSPSISCTHKKFGLDFLVEKRNNYINVLCKIASTAPVPRSKIETSYITITELARL